MKILFIHSSINQKRRQAAIRGVIKDGVWMVESNDVKAEFKDHFQSQFSKDGGVRPTILSDSFLKLSTDQITSLDTPFSCEEITKAMWDCGWIRLQVRMGSRLVSSRDFRSLIECQYKIIGKLLANRLAMVIDSIVIPEQSGFIKGRQILDGPMMLNFLFEVMNKMRFTVNWIAWVKATLTSSRASVLLNGALTEEFDIQRGFRQGSVDMILRQLDFSCIKPMIDKFNKKLSSWKAKLLSIGGRLTLLKSVMGSLAIYYMSIYKVPVTVLKMLESLRARFFWGADLGERKLHWIAWNRVLSARDSGGLGVGSLDAFNKALLFKWIWRFRDNSNALWEHIVSSIHDTYTEGVLGLYNTPKFVLRSGMLNIRGHYFIVQ
uniref:Reverse transcriptase domain, reverse transcriptase zinc-binding domain protein n=1 Tax=Tanacetum cinerariifolium TaxID=118510 RepID=A0A699KEP5_TANCI|nr:reverse transcriptase domain, reverse transcriptase zinc-binding domain protein [Tanacetum cinerariifolium]